MDCKISGKTPDKEKCKTCRYNEDCIADIISDMGDALLEVSSKFINKIQGVVKKHEGE